MTFQAAALAIFAAAVPAGLAGGSVELLDAGGAVLASAQLNSPAGTTAAAVVTFAGFPKTVVAAAAGTPASARFRTAGGANFKTGISVGPPASGAQVIVDNGSGGLALTAGQSVQVAISPTLTLAG